MQTDERERRTLSSVLKLRVFLFLIDWLDPHSSRYLEVGWVGDFGIRVEMKDGENAFQPCWSHFNMFQNQKDEEEEEESE